MTLNPTAPAFTPAADAAAVDDRAVWLGASHMWSLFARELFHLDVCYRAFHVLYLMWLDAEARRALAEEAEIQAEIEEAEIRADMEEAELRAVMEEEAEARAPRRPCRFGAGCRNVSCRFDHGPRQKNGAGTWPPCRFGAGCRDVSCRFDHGL